jgi:hypothetical protein
MVIGHQLIAVQLNLMDLQACMQKLVSSSAD